MLEVEMKFAGVNFTDLERRLSEWGARPDPPIDEADHYFNAPDRDFARTDEALRVRRIGTSNHVTYKGPKRDAQTKTSADRKYGRTSSVSGIKRMQSCSPSRSMIARM